MESESNMQILGSKQSEIKEPYNWVGVFSTGIIDRKDYDEMGFASTTPIQMIGGKKDYWFPTYRIAGNSLQDIKKALLQSIERLFAHVEEIEKARELSKPVEEKQDTENNSK